jgi:transcriptional regulator with XRE-family HTH domain
MADDRDRWLGGGVLRALRVGSGLSQSDMARALAKDPSYVARLEREPTRHPSSDVLVAWARTCPVRTLTPTQIAEDLEALRYRTRKDSTSAYGQWIAAGLVTEEVLEPGAWAAMAAALGLPAAESALLALVQAELSSPPSVATSARLGLTWVALRTVARRGPTDVVEALVATARSNHDSLTQDARARWAALVEAVKVLPAIQAELPPDPEWTALKALWPRLDAAQRSALVVLARTMPRDA